MFKAAGSEETNNGRVIFFPNVFQHHVDAFELADKNKPGHRNIVLLRGGPIQSNSENKRDSSAPTRRVDPR